MVLAAVGEAALLIARSPEPEPALEAGEAAVDTLIVRLFGGAQ